MSRTPWRKCRACCRRSCPTRKAPRNSPEALTAAVAGLGYKATPADAPSTSARGRLLGGGDKAGGDGDGLHVAVTNMDKTIYSKKIAESLSSGNHPEEFATLFVTLLRQLVLGRPVSLVALDAALGWPAQRVATVLEQAPGTEYDEQGNILGLALTLRETPHVFEVEGRRLYTWCALDTLMFPVLIGKTARVASRCAATGTPITLTVAPEAVLDVEPAETMVSLLTPGTSPDIRCSFCCHVHFFASPSAANAWALTHQGIEVVPVESAFGLGHEIAHKLLEDSERSTL